MHHVLLKKQNDDQESGLDLALNALGVLAHLGFSVWLFFSFIFYLFPLILIAIH